MGGEGRGGASPGLGLVVRPGNKKPTLLSFPSENPLPSPSPPFPSQNTLISLVMCLPQSSALSFQKVIFEHIHSLGHPEITDTTAPPHFFPFCLIPHVLQCQSMVLPISLLPLAGNFLLAYCPMYTICRRSLTTCLQCEIRVMGII